MMHISNFHFNSLEDSVGNAGAIVSPAPALPVFGSLEVKSSPKGANVILIKKYSGNNIPTEYFSKTAPATFSLPAGKYTLIVTYSDGLYDYDYYYQEIEVKSSAKKSINVKLKPVNGDLKLIVSPSTAKVIMPVVAADVFVPQGISQFIMGSDSSGNVPNEIAVP